ncbi:Ubiquinone/menaquinone biosynthesis C-methylase UbiE [Collimonas sp. OK242]|jgi:SAM-dependent methyltransferase|uniref:class I SAM-dependent methyltransferase n=1 Tax=Collimonas sp. OK242 TaxID=1798195 RepID=UPI00089D0A46|nr:class I SAM-dependent methyltransferase [Collimonas sp. OK242]SDX27678.1 Ubiquinone/menaquinone biosynthesis C-methylase UbiE [Collimonas sp. OK242]
MILPPEDLEKIAALTLEHYNQRAEDFRAGTRDHDVSQNIAALLRHIEGTPPFSILDVGCGPGRDLRTFSKLGHVAVGVEGAARFVEMARADSGCEVWHQDFLKLDLPDARFDGIFANAALFHIPGQELPRVLRQFHATLKPGGVLFSSNPRGGNQEGWNSGRYGSYHDLAAWRHFMSDAGFSELEHYYRPEGLPREQQPWLASVWRKQS